MHLKRYMTGILAALTLLFTAVPAYAATENAAKVNIVVESDCVDGKVNDPVSKQSLKAKIFKDNPSIHIESTQSNIQNVEVIVYSNEYVEGEDRGIRNRVLKKQVKVGESFRILPEEMYEAGQEDGSIYDFLNHCFVIRVFTDEKATSYVDQYVGIVEDNIYEEMQESQAQKKAEESQKLAKLGPAGKIK